MNTFEITLERQAEGGWPVSVCHERGEGSLALWSSGRFDLDLAALNAAETADLQYGQILGKALFHSDIQDAFVRAVAEARTANDTLRVLLNVEAEDLRGLHWERLCARFDRGWDYLLLSQQTPFSLYLPSQIERRFAPFGRRDLRAILLVAGPEDLNGDYQLEHFDREATIASLRAALGDIPCTVLGSVEGAEGKPTLDELCAQITRLRPTLLHIVCHGRYIQSKGENALYFPKEAEGTPVTGTELITRLGRLDRLPHFTFLSTCESALPEAENGLGGLGQRLVRELGMPAVLAMTDRISISTAGELASTFYARLQEHGEVDRALGEAFAGLQGKGDITVPALFSRLGGHPLFSESLNRPLTPAEVQFGVETLRGLMQVRAPVLLPDLEAQAARLGPGLQADVEALSGTARAEFDAALTALNQFSLEICDLSFNALAIGQRPAAYDARSPFRGLYPFRTEDRDFFKGREALIEKLAGRLKEYPFLAVLGPSGSGKSSLVMAGLIPALGREAAYMTPGSDPVGRLEAALHSDQQVIVADQFEELFTLTLDEARRKEFIERLLRLKEKQPVVITMRADFWGEVAAYEALKEAMQAHQELVAPMDAAELRSAMEQQAAQVGLRFEADLQQTILDDVQGEPGAMPLLQHALLLLWNRRHGRWLRTAEYRAIGGVQQAIAHTAEDVYAGLAEDGRESMRDIFLRLTRLDEETAGGERRDTRRRVRFKELVPAGRDEAATKMLVQHLADARLAVTSVNPVTGEEEVEVAHEALIRHWPRLRNWLEEDRAGLRVREGLREAALEWQAANRDENLLVHRGRRLEDAVLLSKGTRFGLNAEEQDYLSACVALQEREQKAVERRRRAVLIASVGVSIVMLALAIFGLTQAAQARRQAVLARAGELSAQALYYFDKKLDLSMLLAVEAFHQQDSAQTRSSLFGTLSTPYLNRFLAGHSGPVRAVAFSPDGALLASGGHDDTIILWDMKDPNKPGQIATLQGHEGWVTSIAFSPDGKTLASGSNDRTVMLWDISDPSHPVQARRLTGHTGSVYTVAFSPDGKTLASGGEDHTILLWDVSNRAMPRLLDTLEGHFNRLRSLAFNPKRPILVSGGDDPFILTWDISDPGKPKQLQSVPLSADGPVPEGIGQLPPGDIQAQTQPAIVYSLAFSPDGEELAAGIGDAVYQWVTMDASSPELIQMPPLPPRHADAVRSVTYSPDGNILASGSEDNTIILWDRRNWGSFKQLTGASALIYSLAFTPDGSMLASGSGDERVMLWHVLDPDAPRQTGYFLDSNEGVGRLALSPDGKTLASGGNSGTITLTVISEPGGLQNTGPAFMEGNPGGVYSLVYSPDGRLLASGGPDNRIMLWDPGSRQQISVFEGHQNAVLSLAFSPDGKTLASGDHANRIILWDITNPAAPRQIAKMDEHTGFVNSLAFSPDGRTLASGSADHTAILWDVSDPAAPRKLSVLEGHTLEIYNLTFAQNGAVLASGSADTNVILWDVKDPAHPRQIAVLKGHTGPVFDVVASPDGRTLASTGGDKTIVLWDISDLNAPRQITTLQGHSDAVNDLAFDPTGKILFSASNDHSIILWNTDPASLADKACEIAGRNLNQSEWLEFFPGAAYRKTCSQWPEGK